MKLFDKILPSLSKAEKQLKKFQKADDANLPGVMAFRDKKEILGDEWTAVLQHSASFAAKQIKSVVTSQAKAVVKLEALSKKLKRGELPKATLSSVNRLKHWTER